ARVVIAGSSAEYGAAGGNRRPDERAPLEPVTPYGASKHAQALAALAFARQVARIAAGLQPPEVVVGDLRPRRDYVDARDVAAALEVLMRRGLSGECYNVGVGRSTPMSAILRGLAAAGGVRVTERVDPARRR